MPNPFTDHFFQAAIAILAVVAVIIFKFASDPDAERPKPDECGFYELPKKDKK